MPGLFGGRKHHKDKEDGQGITQQDYLDLQNELTELRDQHEDTESRLDVALSTSKSVEQQFTSERDAATKLQEVLEASETRCQELEKEKAAAEEHRKVAVSQLAADAVAHASRTDEAQSQLVETERRIASIREEIASLQDQQKELPEDRSKSSLEQSIAEVSALRTEVKAAQDKAKHLEVLESEHASRVRDLQSALDGTEASISRARAEAAKAEQDAAVFQEEVASHCTVAENLKSAVEKDALKLHSTQLEELRDLDIKAKARDQLIEELRRQIQEESWKRDAASVVPPAAGSSSGDAVSTTENGKHHAPDRAGGAASPSLNGHAVAEVNKQRPQAMSVGIHIYEELHEAQMTSTALRAELASARHALEKFKTSSAEPQQSGELDGRSEEIVRLQREIAKSEEAIKETNAKSEDVHAEIHKERQMRAALVAEAINHQGAAAAVALQGAETNKDELRAEIQAMRTEIYAERSDFSSKFANGLTTKATEGTAVIEGIKVESELLQCVQNELRAEVSAARAASAERCGEALSERGEQHTAELAALQIRSDQLRLEENRLRSELAAESAKMEEAWQSSDIGSEVRALDEANVEMRTELSAFGHAHAPSRAQEADSFGAPQPSAGPAFFRMDADDELEEIQEQQQRCVAELRSELASEQAACRAAQRELQESKHTLSQTAAVSNGAQSDKYVEQHLAQELSEEVARSRRLAEHAWQAEEGRKRLLTELGEAVEFEADMIALAKQVGRAAKAIAIVTKGVPNMAVHMASPAMSVSTTADGSALL